MDFKSQRKNRGRGLKLSIAKYLGCQSTHISQVFDGRKVISLEHAEKLNHYLGHSDEESHFFLLLVQYERSGSPSLKKYFAEQIKKQKELHLNLNHRLQVKNSLTENEYRIYYSSWIYAAIHIFLTIREQGVPPAEIAKRLNIDKLTVQKVLTFLTKTGLAQKKINKYICGQARIHLKDTAPEVKAHHTNWRIKAIDSVAKNHRDNMHYSSVVSLSREDVFKIKNKLIQHLNEIKTTIKASEAETLAGFNIDFFSLENGPDSSV